MATPARTKPAPELLLSVAADGRITATSILQRYRLDAGAADAPSSSWIQVAVVGDFVSPLYGEFSITKKDLRSMLDNFDSGVHPVPPTKLCMDYDHLSERPDAPGDGKAAGWFEELELRANGKELWARIEWTADGAEAIRKKEYQFVSPSYHPAFTTPANVEAGCTLLAAAITNRPFLQGMDPLSLSSTFEGLAFPAARFRALSDKGQRSSQQRKSLADFSFDETMARLREALEERLGNPDYQPWWWLVDVFDTYLIYRRDGKAFRLDYTMSDAGEVTFSGEAVEVVGNWTPLALSARTPEGSMSAKVVKLRDAQGKETEITEEALEALPLVKELRAKVPTGEVVSLADHQKVVGDVVRLTETVKELTDATKQRDADDKVRTLMEAGKILPAQRDHYVKLALTNPDLFKSLSETLTVVSPVKPRTSGETGSADGTTPGGETALAEVEREAQALIAKDTKLSLQDATARVLSTNRALYNRYSKEHSVKV